MRRHEAAINDRGFLGKIIVICSLLPRMLDWNYRAGLKKICSDAVSVLNDIPAMLLELAATPNVLDLRGKI